MKEAVVEATAASSDISMAASSDISMIRESGHRHGEVKRGTKEADGSGDERLSKLIVFLLNQKNEEKDIEKQRLSELMVFLLDHYAAKFKEKEAEVELMAFLLNHYVTTAPVPTPPPSAEQQASPRVWIGGYEIDPRRREHWPQCIATGLAKADFHGARFGECSSLSRGVR